MSEEPSARVRDAMITEPRALPATATLPRVPALPATAELPTVPELPATATLPCVPLLPATELLGSPLTQPAFCRSSPTVSRKASEKAGKGWITSFRTSSGTRARIATVACPSHSPASGPSA